MFAKILFVCISFLFHIAAAIDFSTQAVTDGVTIEKWNQSSMRDVVININISREAKYGICAAQNMSLLRKLKFVAKDCPHVAVARIVYFNEASKELLSFNIPHVFSSTIEHKKAVRFCQQEQFLAPYLLGITPYYGSACRFAHSERGVGVYLMENLGRIVGKGNPFVLIQIKTSLVPCNDCIAFWKDHIKIGKDGNGYFDFACSQSDDCVSVDWLSDLKQKFNIKKIGVNISCNVDINNSGLASIQFKRFL